MFTKLLENIIYNISIYDAAPDAEINGLKFSVLSKRAKSVLVFVEIASMIERIVLLPFQIVGKPILWGAKNVSPKSVTIKKLYDKCPESLSKAPLKIFGCIFGIFSSIIFGICLPKDNYELHVDLGLVNKKLPYDVKKCVEIKYELKCDRCRISELEENLKKKSINTNQVTEWNRLLDVYKARIARNEIAYKELQVTIPERIERFRTVHSKK